MCFTEKQSYWNTFMLIGSALYLLPKWRLSIPLLFLSLKDLIQGLLYRNIKNKNNHNNHILTVLSWLHICFQPLFVNMFVSHFDKKNTKYWNMVFIISTIYAVYEIMNLNKFDIQNDPDCIKIDKKDDFCSDKTLSYLGKYHVAYRFNQDKRFILFDMNIIYICVMIIPALFTKARNVILLWSIFIVLIHIYFRNLGTGETAAIWCFLSIAYVLPVSLLNNQVSKWLSS